MRKLLLALVLALIPALAQAQSTTVTSTVTDAGGVAWVGGTYEFDFVGPAQVTWPGGTVNRVVKGSLDGTGSFSQSLPDNNTISPSPTFFTLKVCPLTGIAQACFTQLSLTITGATLPLTVTPPAIAISGQTNLPVAAYADAEIVAPVSRGFIYYQAVTATSGQYRMCSGTTNSACTTWQNVGGGPTAVTTSGSPMAPNPTCFSSPTTITNCASTLDGINPLSYGVKMDAQQCTGTGSTIVFTSGSKTVSCSTGNFTAGDVGKDIFGTNGCCLGGTNGTVLVPRSTIASVTNPTTVVVSGAAASGNCSGAKCFLAWGTNDDAAWTLAEAAWNAFPNRCGSMFVPAGYSMIRQTHFNSPGALTQCENNGAIVSALDYGPSLFGSGPGSSAFIIEPDIDLTACTHGFGGSTNNGCFLGFSQIVAQNFSFTGGGAAVGAAATTCIVNVGGGSQLTNMGFSGFAPQGANTIGFCGHSGVRMYGVACDGFGATCATTDDLQNSGAENVCFYCFWGDSEVNLVVSSPFRDFGGEIGINTQNSAAAFEILDTAYLYGTRSFFNSGQHSAQGSSAIFVGGTAYMFGNTWDNSGCNGGAGDCNGLFINGTARVFAQGSTFKGHGGGASINGFGCSTCAVFDLGGNNIVANATQFANFTAVSLFGSGSATGVALATGNIALTSGWDTSSTSAITGSDSGQWTVTAAGTPGTSPVITITFPVPFNFAPQCNLRQVGGTNFTDITNPVATTGPTTTGVAFTFTGLPVVGHTYVLQLSCVIP